MLLIDPTGKGEGIDTENQLHLGLSSVLKKQRRG